MIVAEAIPVVVPGLVPAPAAARTRAVAAARALAPARTLRARAAALALAADPVLAPGIEVLRERYQV